MEGKLGEILRIENLMEEVIAYRNNGQLLRKIIKQTFNERAKKLQNVEVSIAEQELKLPKAEELPKLSGVKHPSFDIETILEDCEQTAKALQLLK